MNAINAQADAADDILRISVDAKATVKVGPFTRGGKSCVRTKACDHDFKPDSTVTPVGIFLPESDELFVYEVLSKVTSDCLVDCLLEWWNSVQERFAHISTLVINLDNGPENHSRRSQFLHRMVAFVRHTGILVRLAYYPPYHSKYNPIERCWGILENHWNGALLDTLEAVCNFTASMTWKGIHPIVNAVSTMYRIGIELSQQAMRDVEAQITRLTGLDTWFVASAPVDLRDD